MRIGAFSRIVGKPASTLEDLVQEARQAEEYGFAFLAVPQIFGLDAMTALSRVGANTRSIELLTSVIPIQGRHPLIMAQQALTTQLACSGRFVLGIGLSHQIVIENLMGLSYEKPAQRMHEYLKVLQPLLAREPVAYKGELYHVEAALQVPGVSPLSVIIAALGPRMLRVAGTQADGTVTWMTGLQTLESYIVPTIRAAATEAGRARPRVCAALPMALVRDPEAARELAAKRFATYGMLPSYRAMLDREGAEGPADVTIVGAETELRAALSRLSDAGVTDFAAVPFGAEPDSDRRTLEFLRGEI